MQQSTPQMTPVCVPGKDVIGVTVSFFCHDGKGNFLLNKRSTRCRDEHGRWDCGGGSVPFGEKVLDTLHREVKEEYNARILHSEFLGIRDVHRVQDGVPTHWISVDYKVLVDPAEVRNNEPAKFDEIGWFALLEMPEPMHSQWELAVAQYAEKLRSR